MLNVKNCFKCDISLYRRNIVNGYGDRNASIMFIGEAPGGTEDKYAVPFIGPAGKLFNSYLGLCNLSRDEVFVTNVIRCRPPGNRIPSPIEIHNCFPNLLADIAEVKPKIIMLLGSVALKSYFNNNSAKITKCAGSVIRLNHKIIIPNYHPSHILMNKDKYDESLAIYRKMIDVYRSEFNPFHESNF